MVTIRLAICTMAISPWTSPFFAFCPCCSGKYQPGVDNPDPKTWKANFRCAMNSLPDIEEVKDKSIKKGTNAFRVYKMLLASERSAKKGNVWISAGLCAPGSVLQTPLSQICQRASVQSHHKMTERHSLPT